MRSDISRGRKAIMAWGTLIFSVFSIAIMAYFFIFRVSLFLRGGYSPIDWLPAFLLLFGEMFLLFHSFGFALSMIKSLRYSLPKNALVEKQYGTAFKCQRPAKNPPFLSKLSVFRIQETAGKFYCFSL